MQPDPATDDRTMFEKGVDLLVAFDFLDRPKASNALQALLRLWKTPTWDVATCPRECTILTSDEMNVVRGAATDFGLSWTQQICKILNERQDRIDEARRKAEMSDDGA